MEVIESLLIGEYKIIQDTERYRFTSDAVHLARFVKAKKGEVVADFCAGSGVVGLHFFAENEGVKSVTLFESDEGLAAMSAKTVALNHLEESFTVENVRLQQIPVSYIEKFSLILCNPPYERGGFEKASEEIAPCRMELTLTLEELADAAKRCLKYGGRFAVVHRADRAAELISTLHVRGLEPKKLQFIAGKEGRKPYAVLLLAVKGGKPGVDVLPTIINQKEERTTPSPRGTPRAFSLSP